jgi:hypothetical protein
VYSCTPMYCFLAANKFGAATSPAPSTAEDFRNERLEVIFDLV